MGLSVSISECAMNDGSGGAYFKGDPRDLSSNPLRSDEVGMNLPGSEGYDPTLLWVSKICAWATTTLRATSLFLLTF